MITLHTARLTLRPLKMTDFAAYGAFLASARSWGLGGPFDTAAAWGMFCHDAGLWALAGHGGLMIDTADGETVGSVGINAGPLFAEAELGWFLYDGHEGRGYATEAATALRDWGFAHAGLSTMVSNVDPANAASSRLALRLGARLDPDALRQPGDESDLIYRHPRPV